MHVLGIDVGGTKTVCLLGDDEGRVVASARGPGANLQAVGELELEKVLHTVMEETVAHQGAVPSAICLGIAGVDRPEDTTVVRSIMSRIGYKARLLVVNDALIALRAGIGDGAGRGHRRRDRFDCVRLRSPRLRRAGGRVGLCAWRRGQRLLDGTSGAARHRARGRRARGSRRASRRACWRISACQRPEELLHTIYRDNLKPAAVAALATDVQQARDEGDEVAAAILERAAQELVAAAASVSARLGLTDEEFAFVLAGGMFKAAPWLRERIAQLLPDDRTPQPHVPLEVEPALGAVRLALAEIHGGARLPVYKRRLDEVSARPQTCPSL